MKAVRPSVILLCGQDPAAMHQVRRLLTSRGHEVHCRQPEDPAREDVSSYQLVIVEASGCHDQSLNWCRRLRSCSAGPILPLLFITPDPSPPARLASFEAGADTYLIRPFLPEELLAQSQALLRIREFHDRLEEKTAEVHRVNSRLQQAYQQIDQELELARRLQASFLPQRLPEVPQARF